MTNPRYANGNLRRKHRERCGQWTANAASVMVVSVRFIMMNLQTRSIRSPLWWTRSGLYPNGGSSGIRRHGQRLRTGRTCKRRIISAMRKKATKPGKTARKPAKKGQKLCRIPQVSDGEW